MLPAGPPAVKHIIHAGVCEALDTEPRGERLFRHLIPDRMGFLRVLLWTTRHRNAEVTSLIRWIRVHLCSWPC